MENGTESSTQEYQCEHCTFRRAFVPYHSATALEILHTKDEKTQTIILLKKDESYLFVSG